MAWLLNDSIAMDHRTTNDSDDGLQSEDNSHTMAFIISVLILIIVTVASNSLVFIAVYTFRGLRTVTNYFVVSLATADLSVALLAMPVWLSSALVPLDTEYKTSLFEICTRWVDIFCASVSIYSASLVSLDRFIAINKPLRYKEMVTSSRAKKAIASVWFMSIVITAFSFIQYHSYMGIYVWVIFSFIVILCIPLIIMVFSYVCIYRAAVEQLSKMKYNEYTTADPLYKNRKTVSERRKRFYKELCITKTLGITISLFIIAWAPFLTMIMVETFHPYHEPMPVFLQRLILYLPYINSFVNPWVYAGINRDFRKALKKIVCAPQELCKMETKRNRASSASTGKTLIGSFRTDEQIGSLRSDCLSPHTTPIQEFVCTAV